MPKGESQKDTRTVEVDGQKVRELRRAIPWSQQRLAEESGNSKRTIEKIESGEPVFPQTVETIAKALGVKPNTVLATEDSSPQGDKTPFQTLIDEKTEGFVGRKYVFAAIDQFVERESKGHFVIEGDPGMGKTAILAQYVDDTNCIAHFNVRSSAITTASQFLQSICPQIIARYGLLHPSFPITAAQDGAFLMDVLTEAGKKLDIGEKLIIAVDALDEVDLTGHALGANILYLPSVLPNGVYFVLTRRNVDVPLTLDATLALEPFDLMKHSAESEQDVRTYIHQREAAVPFLRHWIEDQGRTVDDFVSTLAGKSKNNFMYLRYVLGDIERGLYTDLRIDRLPNGLERYYEDHWDRMGMTIKPLPRAKIEILYILSEVRRPASRQFVEDCVKKDAISVQAVLTEWKQFLHIQDTNEQKAYSVYHQSFREFLSCQDIIAAAGVTLKGINQKLFNQYFEDLEEDD